MNTIFNRRSVRQFKDQKVESDKIESLLRAAMQAPSAINQQPWEFLVVTNKESLVQLSKMSPYSAMVEKAPLAIIVLTNTSIMKAPQLWQQDAAAATENILLQAVDLDLGAVWLGVGTIKEREDYIKKMFDLPENITPFNVIAIGYSTNENANKFVDRYDEKKVHYEKY
jgi:nitroreductase